MKYVDGGPQHRRFVEASLARGGSIGPADMRWETRVIVAEADEPDDDGRPVYLGWAGRAHDEHGPFVLWSYVVRSKPLQEWLDKELLSRLGFDVSPGAELRVLLDCPGLKRAAARHGWRLV